MKATSAFQAVKQGILICDREGRITYYNAAYEEYIGVSLKNSRGRRLTDYRPGAKVPEVIETGIPEEGVYREEHGQGYFASIYPIQEEEGIVGSISIVTSIELSKKQKEVHTGTLNERVRRFEGEEIRYMMSLYGSNVSSKKKIAEELGISLATLYNKLQS